MDRFIAGGPSAASRPTQTSSPDSSLPRVLQSPPNGQALRWVVDLHVGSRLTVRCTVGALTLLGCWETGRQPTTLNRLAWATALGGQFQGTTYTPVASTTAGR